MEKHASTHGIVKLFAYYKELAEKAVVQVKDEDLGTAVGADGNSIAVVMRHIAGNLRSRFTDFLSTDGEKPWRNREGEFAEVHPSRATLLEEWDGAWAVFFKEVGPLGESDMGRTVLIRNEPHTVLDALHRQLGHYAYHVGQIVFMARTFTGESWKSLSIPRGGSAKFNSERGV
ncbi:MAG: DUF1572 family protein [Flavobacteriales bacterium]